MRRRVEAVHPLAVVEPGDAGQLVRAGLSKRAQQSRRQQSASRCPAGGLIAQELGEGGRGRNAWTKRREASVEQRAAAEVDEDDAEIIVSPPRGSGPQELKHKPVYGAPWKARCLLAAIV